EGAAMSFSGTGSSPDGGTVSLVWNFGDGTGTATGASVQHTFADNGPYTVTLTPTDALGVQGAAAPRTVTITNVPPTATFTATPQIFKGEASTLAFSNPFDPSPVDTRAGFLYTYDCTTNGTLTVASNRAATATCTYPTAGTFTVTGTITDKDGGATPYTAPVTVLTSQQATSTLASQVQALASQHVLSGGQTNALTAKLNHAIDKLNAGKTTVAVNELRAFISQVNDLAQTGVLSAAEGQALTSTAQRILASLGVS